MILLNKFIDDQINHLNTKNYWNGLRATRPNPSLKFIL